MKKEDVNTEFNLDYENKSKTEDYKQTKCTDCVFETFPKLCEFDIPNNLNEKSLTLFREEDNQEHYRINGFCRSFRPEIWKTANRGKDLISIVEKENALNLSVIIKVNKIEEIAETVDSLERQEPKPRRAVIVYTDDSIDHLEVLTEVKKQGDKVSFPLFLTTFFFTDILDNDFKLIDSAFGHVKSGHYSVFETGLKIPENWCSSINDAINKHGKSICYIRPIEGYIHGLTCQTMMHKFLYGHNGASLEQKIREGLEHDENDTQMIFDWEEIK